VLHPETGFPSSLQRGILVPLKLNRTHLDEQAAPH